MSYCRWSSDNFKSDFYEYNAISGGIEIMVSGRLALPNDGQCFTEPDKHSAIIRVKELIKKGYHAPDYLLPALMEEIEGDVTPLPEPPQGSST